MPFLKPTSILLTMFNLDVLIFSDERTMRYTQKRQIMQLTNKLWRQNSP